MDIWEPLNVIRERLSVVCSTGGEAMAFFVV